MALGPFTFGSGSLFPSALGSSNIATAITGLGFFSSATLAAVLANPRAQPPALSVLLQTFPELTIRVLLGLVALASLTVNPVVNCLLTFGEEFGWTGYLLPKLLPLGKWNAAVLYGAIWGLWHAPLILGGLNYPRHPYVGVLLMYFVTTSIALNQSAVRLRTGSVFSTTFLHACFDAQARGFWAMAFVVSSPLLGGAVGLMGCLVIACVGCFLLANTEAANRQAANRK